MIRIRGAAAAGILALVMILASCAPGGGEREVPPSALPSSSPGEVATEGWWRAAEGATTLASGLDSPWSVVPLQTGGSLISQRDDGRILEVTATGDVREVGTVPGVLSGGESGLHGLTLLADEGTTWLYAYHGAAADNRVVRMPLDGAAGSFMLGDPEVILSAIPRAGSHDGGRIAFGPDGFLYVTTGDAQQRDTAQDRDSLGGKILRLTPEGDPAPGNPFGSAVWSYGHRNVQGIAWSRDGTMWASEFGQNTWDELNRIEPGGNYGWPVVEGDEEHAGFVRPIAVWPTDDASPSGIAVLGDTVILASLRGERLWFVDIEDGGLARPPVAALTGEQGRLRDVVVAPDGALWVLTNNTDGRGSPRPDDDLLIRLPVEPAT